MIITSATDAILCTLYLPLQCFVWIEEQQCVSFVSKLESQSISFYGQSSWASRSSSLWLSLHCHHHNHHHHRHQLNITTSANIADSHWLKRAKPIHSSQETKKSRGSVGVVECWLGWRTANALLPSVVVFNSTVAIEWRLWVSLQTFVGFSAAGGACSSRPSLAGNQTTSVANMMAAVSRKHIHFATRGCLVG